MAGRCIEPARSLRLLHSARSAGGLFFLASSTTRLFRRPGPSVSPSVLGWGPQGHVSKPGLHIPMDPNQRKTQSFVRIVQKPDYCVYSWGPQPVFTAGAHSQRSIIFFLTKGHCYPVPLTSTADIFLIPKFPLNSVWLSDGKLSNTWFSINKNTQ